MADTLVAGTPRRLLVDGRNPTADEAITAGADLDVAAADTDGNVLVSAGAAGFDGDLTSISVAPGAADVNRTAGSDDITLSVPVVVVPTPLAVTSDAAPK